MTSEDIRRSRRRGLSPDQIIPTEKQIAENIVVIPKAFLDRVKIDRYRFRAIVLGNIVENRRLDSENRVSVPIRNSVAVGKRLRLSVRDGVLHIEQDS